MPPTYEGILNMLGVVFWLLSIQSANTLIKSDCFNLPSPLFPRAHFLPLIKMVKNHPEKRGCFEAHDRNKGEAGQLSRAVPDFAGPPSMIRDEKGCLDCHTYRDVEDEEVLFLPVQWKSLASLEHYMQSESGSALVGAIDLLSETARVGFDRDSPWEGINTLRRMRKKTSQ